MSVIRNVLFCVLVYKRQTISNNACFSLCVDISPHVADPVASNHKSSTLCDNIYRAISRLSVITTVLLSTLSIAGTDCLLSVMFFAFHPEVTLCG